MSLAVVGHQRIRLSGDEGLLRYFGKYHELDENEVGLATRVRAGRDYKLQRGPAMSETSWQLDQLYGGFNSNPDRRKLIKRTDNRSPFF